MSAIIFQVQSCLIVALMLYGASLVWGANKNRFRHIKMMKLAMIWDIILILQIELTRGAIAKASKAMENPMILNVHVSLAIGTVLLYAFVAYSGSRLANGNEGKRQVHKTLGLVTLTTRVLTLITSFFVL